MQVLCFPLLHLSLFPRTTKPLHVFETRYLEMVHRAVQEAIPIAIAFLESAEVFESLSVGEAVQGVREVAGFGPCRIVEERSNGTLLVFVQGLGRLRLTKVLKKYQGYFLLEGEELPEQEEVSLENERKLKNLESLLLTWIKNHIPDHGQRELFMRNLHGPGEILGALSAYMIRDYDIQQTMLEIGDANEKIDFFERLLGSGELLGSHDPFPK